MGLVVEELEQLESDLVWFAKGHWIVGYDKYDKPIFCHGDDVPAFQTMIDQYHSEKEKAFMIDLAMLAGKAIMDTTYPTKEFGEFFMFWDMLARKRLDEGEEVPRHIVAEAMLMILMRWDIEEGYALLPPSWNKGMFDKKKKKELNYDADN